MSWRELNVNFIIVSSASLLSQILIVELVAIQNLNFMINLMIINLNDNKQRFETTIGLHISFAL